MTKPKAIIVDIDWCLLLSKDGTAPYEEGYKSNINIQTHILSYMVQNTEKMDCEIILLTARQERLRRDTEVQLERHYYWSEWKYAWGIYSKLIMNDLPKVSGRVYKAHEYKRIKTRELKEKYDIILAIDDCPANIMMFQAEGIPTLQCTFEPK